MRVVDKPEKKKSSGVIVKYNPCSSYARGSPCPDFVKAKKCYKPPLSCEMPEYDSWYKNVLTGQMKCYYPHRIPLLENFSLLVFVFHVHHHAITGEARIVRSSREDGRHLYWFQKFHRYDYPVELELLRSDSKLPRMARFRRWRHLYISQKVITEIRSYSKLSESERIKKGETVKLIIEQLREHPPFVRKSLYRKVYSRKECEELSRIHGIPHQVLNVTRNYFLRSAELKVVPGTSHKERFYTSLYIAYRMLRKPELVNDITEISGLSPNRLHRLYRLFVAKLNLTVPPLNPLKLIESRAGRLNLSRKTVKEAVFLAEEAKKRRAEISKAASSTAAVATFVACQKTGEHRTQGQIAEAFGVSTTMIREKARRLEGLLRE